MPAVYLVGYEGRLPSDMHEGFEQHPGPRDERELIEGVSISLDMERGGSKEQHLLHPMGDPDAKVLAEDLGRGLNLVPVEFEPVEWNDNALQDFLTMGSNVKKALGASGIQPSEKSQILVLTPTVAIAKILTRDEGDIYPGTAHFSAIVSTELDEVLGQIRERELREG